jgi:hypothetical protein
VSAILFVATNNSVIYRSLDPQFHSNSFPLDKAIRPNARTGTRRISSLWLAGTSN